MQLLIMLGVQQSSPEEMTELVSLLQRPDLRGEAGTVAVEQGWL